MLSYKKLGTMVVVAGLLAGCDTMGGGGMPGFGGGGYGGGYGASSNPYASNGGGGYGTHWGMNSGGGGMGSGGFGSNKKQILGAGAGAALGGWAGSGIGNGTGQLAATAGGVLLGALLGGTIGGGLDDIDRQNANMALAQSMATNRPTQWQGNQGAGVIQPTRDIQTASGQFCREFRHTIMVGPQKKQGVGTACLNPDGTWRIVG